MDINKRIRKKYRKPAITRVELDNSISLVMMSTSPTNPTPRGSSQQRNNNSDPFASPFGTGNFQ